jgi:hypothetical protein
MFGPMKEVLKGRRFSSDEVTGVGRNWLKTQPKDFFPDGIFFKKKKAKR